MKKKSLFILLTVFLLAIALTAVAGASPAQTNTSDVFWFAPFPTPGDQVEGAQAKLTTNESGATVRFQTSGLTPGNAYTVWWIIFNNPAACAAPGCSDADFGNAAALPELTYATGHVIGDSGKGNFGAHLQAGEVPGGWFGYGFTNPTGAEIHVAIHDHGPMIPSLVNEMISTFAGGCSNDYSGMPPNAQNGTPGPNECATVQFTVVKQ